MFQVTIESQRKAELGSAGTREGLAGTGSEQRVKGSKWVLWEGAGKDAPDREQPLQRWRALGG